MATETDKIDQFLSILKNGEIEISDGVPIQVYYGTAVKNYINSVSVTGKGKLIFCDVNDGGNETTSRLASLKVDGVSFGDITIQIDVRPEIEFAQSISFEPYNNTSTSIGVVNFMIILY